MQREVDASLVAHIGAAVEDGRPGGKPRQALDDQTRTIVTTRNRHGRAPLPVTFTMTGQGFVARHGTDENGAESDKMAQGGVPSLRVDSGDEPPLVVTPLDGPAAQAVDDDGFSELLGQ